MMWFNFKICGSPILLILDIENIAVMWCAHEISICTAHLCMFVLRLIEKPTFENNGLFPTLVFGEKENFIPTCTKTLK